MTNQALCCGGVEPYCSVDMDNERAMQSPVAPFDEGVLNQERSTIYALTSDLRISFVNAGWRHFARENGAPAGGSVGVGERMIDAIPVSLRPFYQKLFDQALKTRHVAEHEYECSSPALLRRFRMRIFPCTAGGLLVVHTPVAETPHSAAESPALESLFRNASGVIVQCSHCRRVQRAAVAEWAWVPAFVERMPRNTSHGLCAVCAEYYYPADDIG